ncbi:MAG TPA: response regulator transcription factor [Clostridia bacterium]|nr:response regulator transcription factor [Clostridia bacterium]
MIRLMICEDVKDVREGFRYLLNMEEEIKVVAAYESAEKLMEGLTHLGAPDIILMDIELPGMSGIEATTEIKRCFPEVAILILTIFEEQEKILNAIQAGATGYILKNSKPGELVAQIRALHSGGSPISPNVARVLLQEFQRDYSSKDHEDYNLTPREKEIVKGIVNGLTYREIADHYCIASSTVKKHILHIYKKLNVRSKVEFMKKVMETDLI